MLFEQIMFFVAAAGALAGALGVVILRNPFYSVLALIVHLISLAGLFLLSGCVLSGGVLSGCRTVRPAAPVPERTAVLEAVCAGRDWPFDGWAAANTSRRRAMDARQRVCGPVGVRR